MRVLKTPFYVEDVFQCKEPRQKKQSGKVDEFPEEGECKRIAHAAHCSKAVYNLVLNAERND